MHRISMTLIAATLVAGLAACGGGGGKALPTTAGSPSTPSQLAQTQSAKAQMTVYIPPHASAAGFRNPKYISASTQSMTIGIQVGTQTAQLAEADLTPSSPNCAAQTGGGTQCSVTFLGTAGTATYVVSMYNQTGGKGSVLSTADIQATLSTATNTTIPLALDGVPATVAVVLGVGELPVGTASTTGVFVQAQDASGNIIVGPGGFSTPITLAVTGDTYNTLALSSTSVASPGQVVTLAYNGGTNVGATITPSISGATGTAATFAGSGASLTVFPSFFDPNTNTYMYPENVAASGSNAVALIDGWYGGCCSTYAYALQMMTPSGLGQRFIGDTTDPFNPPGVEPTFTGFTVVHGMSEGLDEETFEAYDDLAMNANGIVYYSGYFGTNSDTTNCSGLNEQSGTLGVLNTTAATTTEYRLKGYPGAIRIDSAGNVWFIESSGTCNGVSLIGGNGYAVGELPAASGTVVEKPFNTIGLGAISYPGDMSITPDGSTMYIADYDGSTITQVTTASLTPSTPIALVQSLYPYAIASGPDGTTAWFSDNEPNENYYYGWLQGSKAFSSANLSEAPFPINAFYSYAMAYADGSFWIAGDDYGTGIGRLSGAATGTPVAGYYAMPYPDGDGQDVIAIAASGGYVWGGDDEYGNVDVMQYGAPSSGTVTYSSRMIGIANSIKRQPSATARGHHVQSKRRAAH